MANTLTQVRQIVAEMRSVQASEGISGVTRYMADAVNDSRLEFDAMLKLASRPAILYGDAGRLDDAFDYLDQAIAARDPALVYLSIAPHWDTLRGDSVQSTPRANGPACDDVTGTLPFQPR